MTTKRPRGNGALHASFILFYFGLTYDEQRTRAGAIVDGGNTTFDPIMDSADEEDSEKEVLPIVVRGESDVRMDLCLFM